MDPDLADDLRAGRRALEGLQSVRILDDWTWNPASRKFALRVEVQHNGKTDVVIPRRTEWFVLVQPTYPDGTVKINPAALRGITSTFQHQGYNGDEPGTKNWRDGDICVRSTVQVLGRSGLDQEPTGAHERLLWNLGRAVDWLTNAADGTLALPGEPFELPAFPSTAGKTPYIAFWEAGDSFAEWQETPEAAGLVDFRELEVASPHALVAEVFYSIDERRLVAREWGDIVRSGRRVRGVWIRLPSAPVMPPWEIPSNWERLLPICLGAGVDVPKILNEQAVPGEVQQAVLLVGFPIPRNIGEPNVSYHWQGIKLPALRSAPPGRSRRRVAHYRRLDPLRALAGDIEWLPSHNWAAAELGSRGMLPDWVRARHVIILGVGAVGSLVSELFVRGGAHRLTLVDDETVDAGNLARHALTLSDLMKNKAERMAERLRIISPHALVTALSKNMDAAGWTELAASLTEPILLVDCSGENTAIQDAGRVAFDPSTRFVSISFGLNATPLYLFTAEGPRFPADELLSALDPYLKATAATTREETLARDGIGCWHLVFPARADEVCAAVSTAMRLIATDFGPHGLRVVDIAERTKV